MSLRALQRKVAALRRAIDPAPAPPAPPSGPPSVVLMLPDNNSGGLGIGRHRRGDVELWIYPPGEPPAGEAG